MGAYRVHFIRTSCNHNKKQSWEIYPLVIIRGPCILVLADCKGKYCSIKLALTKNMSLKQVSTTPGHHQHLLETQKKRCLAMNWEGMTLWRPNLYLFLFLFYFFWLLTRQTSQIDYNRKAISPGVWPAIAWNNTCGRAQQSVLLTNCPCLGKDRTTDPEHSIGSWLITTKMKTA